MFELVSDFETTETLSIDFLVILKSYLEAEIVGLCAIFEGGSIVLRSVFSAFNTMR